MMYVSQQEIKMAKSAAMDFHTSAKKPNYSAKAAAAGKDIGKPGKNFAKIAAKAGGGEKGERIAGAVLKRLRAKS